MNLIYRPILVLFKRFKFIKIFDIIIIVKKRYIFNDVIKYRELREYIIIIIRAIKIIKLSDIYNQFDII